MGKLKKSHDHVTKIIVTISILNSRRPIVQMRPNLYFECFPFDSSGFDGDNHFLAQTAQLADNMLLMEYEMVNDDQVDVRKQLKETALFTNALLKKVALRI